MAVAACGSSSPSGTFGLAVFEIDFLVEDNIDLFTIGFQSAENAWVGDAVDPADVVEPAAPANNFTVHYLLPLAVRAGLGEGEGEVFKQVFEDGVVHQDPLAFEAMTTNALTVEIIYDLDYLGIAASGRPSDVIWTVFVSATRTSTAEPFTVEYNIVGDCFVGETFCDWDILFICRELPRDGILGPSTDAGGGIIDDPDVFDFFDFHAEWRETDYFSRGPVGFSAFFEALFFYDEVIF